MASDSRGSIIPTPMRYDGNDRIITYLGIV